MKASNRVTRRIFLDFIRVFNKHFFNRITLWLSKRGKGPYSVITHKGRRTGRIYKTPVLATFVDDFIFIPLSYGDHVDWLRNVLAYDSCKILWKSKEITAIDPEVIEAGQDEMSGYIRKEGEEHEYLSTFLFVSRIA